MAVNNIIKRIQNIMRQDAGINGDAQRIEQMTWMFFLKVYDTQEETWEYKDENYKSIIPEELRWRNWAVDEKDGEALTGEVLLSFVNEKLFPALKNLPVNADTPRAKSIVQETFADLNQYMKNGTLLRQVINIVNEIEFYAPKIPYRETITKYAQADYRHKKQSGGAGQFGEVHMVIEPYEEGMPEPTTYKIGGVDSKMSIKGKEEYDLPWGGKLVFYNCIVGGVIEARFMPAILKGIMEKMEEGPLTGSYARDIRVCIYDGKMHPVDSNEISFMLAGRNAFSEAFKNAGPKILEPIYDVEVFVPSDRMGDVMGDL